MLAAALRVFATAFQRFHDRAIRGRTAHNAECVGVDISLFMGKGENELSGTIRLVGVRTDLSHPFQRLMAKLITDDTTNLIHFDSIDELAELLK